VSPIFLRRTVTRNEEKMSSHHGGDTQRSNETLIPREKDLREVLGDGEDGREQAVAERKEGPRASELSRERAESRKVHATYASAILESLRSGASLGLG